jgi:phosphomannomutase/phosphoglucomutase
MITGSHNAAEYNGFKICVGKEAIHGDAIQELRRVMEAGVFTSGHGTKSEHPIIPDYLAYIKKSFNGVTRGICTSSSIAATAPHPWWRRMR